MRSRVSEKAHHRFTGAFRGHQGRIRLWPIFSPEVVSGILRAGCPGIRGGPRASAVQQCGFWAGTSPSPWAYLWGEARQRMLGGAHLLSNHRWFLATCPGRLRPASCVAKRCGARPSHQQYPTTPLSVQPNRRLLEPSPLLGLPGRMAWLRGT